MIMHSPSTSERGSILGPGSSQLQLTPRERQVVDYIGAGFSHKKAGRALGITEKTVSNYAHGIAQRIEGDGMPRAKIIAWALTHGDNA